MVIDEGKYLIIFRSHNRSELESLTKIPNEYKKKYFLVNNVNEMFTTVSGGKYYKIAQPKYFEEKKKREKLPIDDNVMIIKDKKLIQIISEN